MITQNYYSQYKPTGNVAVDMVGACISHYRKVNRVKRPTRIMLSSWYWKQFIEFAKRSGWDIDENSVNWEGICDICKGSQLQTKPLEVEFEAIAEA